MRGGQVMEGKSQKTIDDVAIYLRKSRGDVDTDLEKHRLLLRERCEEIGAKYVEYAEIGTSDSIKDRPAFTELLRDLELDLYDAVAVVDIDRLGRGGDRDWAEIEEIFRKAEIYIITPEKIYNWENESDEFEIDIKKFLARMEYKQTTKRLRRGKIMGAKQGKWTNGRPPYPYIYNRAEQKLEVDREKEKVYRQIIDRALEGETAENIAWDLNRMHVPSPGGSTWSNVAVYRLLKDMTHLGKIVIGKTSGGGHKNKKTKPLKVYDESEWLIFEGLHEPLKTEEEHEKILELLEKRKIVPVRARARKNILSGLVSCANCGRTLKVSKNGNKTYVIKCQNRDPYGNMTCSSQGINQQVIVDEIFRQLGRYEEEITQEGEQAEIEDIKMLEDFLLVAQESLRRTEKELDNLVNMRISGEIDKSMYARHKAKREERAQKIKQEIRTLESRINRRKSATNAQRLENIREFRRQWENAKNDKERNQFLHRIIDRIYYSREGENICININFL